MGVFEQIKGKAKEVFGGATNNAPLKEEGRAQQEKGEAETEATKARVEAKGHEAKAKAKEFEQKAAQAAKD